MHDPIDIHQVFIAGPNVGFIRLSNISPAAVLEVPFVSGRFLWFATRKRLPRAAKADFHAPQFVRTDDDVPGEWIGKAVMQAGQFQGQDAPPELLHDAEFTDADHVQAATKIGREQQHRAGRKQFAAAALHFIPRVAQAVLQSVKIDEQAKRIEHDRQRTDLVQYGCRYRRNPSAGRGRHAQRVEDNGEADDVLPDRPQHALAAVDRFGQLS